MIRYRSTQYFNLVAVSWESSLMIGCMDSVDTRFTILLVASAEVDTLQTLTAVEKEKITES